MARPNEFSRATMQLALARQRFRCGSCGTHITKLGNAGLSSHRFGEGAQAHHLRHVKRGGRDSVENCVILCQSCHYSVHEGGNYRFGREESVEADYPYFRERSSTLVGKKYDASSLSMSAAGIELLKQIEELRLRPYDDQSGKETNRWVEGATIGYGHLIQKSEWSKYKEGISVTDARSLFDSDLAPFIRAVQKGVTTKVSQNQFDALVCLAFNIGAGANGFSESSVLKLVNDPTAKTKYADLESAWKAWNKSQGMIMKGLVSRRDCEWKIYSRGIYERW